MLAQLFSFVNTFLKIFFCVAKNSAFLLFDGRGFFVYRPDLGNVHLGHAVIGVEPVYLLLDVV